MEQTTQYDKLIFDGNNFLFRAYFTKRPEKIINGVNATAVHQFLSMFKSAVARFQPKEIYLTWDKKVNPTKPSFRKDLIAYKEQRVESDAKNKMFETIPVIQEFMDNLGVKTIYPHNMEADDVIRFLAVNDTKSTIIISSDNDLFQLIDPYIHQFIPTKNIILTTENFEEVALVKPDCYLIYKCILGDKSDNINGLEGFGPVKSKNLVTQLFVDNNSFKDIISFDDLENLFKNNFEEEDAQTLIRNMKLMFLKYTEVLDPEEYGHYRDQAKNFNSVFDADKIRELFSTYEMHQFLRGFGEWNKLFNSDFENSDLLSQIMM